METTFQCNWEEERKEGGPENQKNLGKEAKERLDQYEKFGSKYITLQPIG